MADKEVDDVLEEATADEEGSGKKKFKISLPKLNLSKKTLLIIAISLLVLIIAILGAFFFFSGSDDAQPKDEKAAVEQTENTDTNDEKQAAQSGDQQQDELELPPVAGDTETTAAKENMANNATPMQQASGAEATMPQPATDDSATTLQKQLEALQAQNKQLQQQVQKLNAEIQHKNSIIHSTTMMDTQSFVNDQSPRHYESAQRIKLDPKWGEFEHLNKNK